MFILDHRSLELLAQALCLRNEPSHFAETLPWAKWPGNIWAKPRGNLCFLLQGILLLAAWIQLCISSVIPCAPLLSGKSILTRKFSPALLQASFYDVLLYITRVTSAAAVPRACRHGASFNPNSAKGLSLASQVLATPISNTRLLSLLLQCWHWLLRK